MILCACPSMLQAGGAPGDINREAILPSITTPRIETEQPDLDGPDINLPAPIVKEVPAGAEQFKFVLKRLDIEGAFGEVEDTLPDLYSQYIDQEITVVDLFNIALAIQSAYYEAGYFLVQVFVPAQTIENGIARIVISEAYISNIDVSALPERYQEKSKAIFSSLLESPHVRRQEVERKLLLVNNLAGLTIETTLTPGKEPQSTILVVEGRSRLLSGYLTIDNYASLSLKEWEGLFSVSLNSALGLGEAFTFQSTFHPSLNELDRGQRIKSSGSIAANIPVGNDGLAVNLNAIRSVTHPKGKLTPLEFRGRLNGWSAGVSYPYLLTRKNAVNIDASFDYADEVLQTDLAGPRVTLSHDSLRILRFGASWNHKKDDGRQLLVGGKLSQGLNAFGARDDPSSGAGLSRAEGKVNFTKLETNIGWHQPLPKNFTAAFSAKGQWTPDSLLVPEQFTLGGPDFGSAQAIGAAIGDYGFGTRAEIQRFFPINMVNYHFGIQPYVFSDYGRAYLKKPTAAEEKFTAVASAGAGLRLNLFSGENNARAVSASLEYACQLDGPPDEDTGDKLSLLLVMGF